MAPRHFPFFRILTATAFLFGLSQVAHAAGMVAAKRNGVKVFATASKKGKVIKTLQKGEAVESKDRKGMYWQVTVDGKPGFVSVMKVKRKKGKASSLTKKIQSAVSQGRDAEDVANNRSRSAVMGVRGLDESSETAFAGNVKPNLRMVYKMEDILVKPDQIEKLGEQVFAEIESKVGDL